jgi:hypothetical protein
MWGAGTADRCPLGPSPRRSPPWESLWRRRCEEPPRSPFKMAPVRPSLGCPARPRDASTRLSLVRRSSDFPAKRLRRAGGRDGAGSLMRPVRSTGWTPGRHPLSMPSRSELDGLGVDPVVDRRTPVETAGPHMQGRTPMPPRLQQRGEPAGRKRVRGRQAVMGHSALATTGRYLHARPVSDQAASRTMATGRRPDLPNSTASTKMAPRTAASPGTGRSATCGRISMCRRAGRQPLVRLART